MIRCPGSRRLASGSECAKMRGERGHNPRRLSKLEMKVNKNIAKAIDRYCKRYEQESKTFWFGTCSLQNLDPFGNNEYHVPDESELERMSQDYQSVTTRFVKRLNGQRLEELKGLAKEGNRFALRRLAEFHADRGEAPLARSYLLHAIMCGDTESAINSISDRRLSPHSDLECWSELAYAVGPAIAVCPGFLERAERLASKDPRAAGIVADWMRQENGYEDLYARFLECGLKDTSSRAADLRAYDICHGKCSLREINERDVCCLRHSSNRGDDGSSIMLGRLSLAGISVGRNIDDAIYYFAKACIQTEDWLPRAWMAYLAYPEAGVGRGCRAGNRARVPECTVLDDLIRFGARCAGSDGNVYEDDLFLYRGSSEQSTVSLLHFKPLGTDVPWDSDGPISTSCDFYTDDIRQILRICIDDVFEGIFRQEYARWDLHENGCCSYACDDSEYDDVDDYLETLSPRCFDRNFRASGLCLEYDTMPLLYRGMYGSREHTRRERYESETLGERVRDWFGRILSRA